MPFNIMPQYVMSCTAIQYHNMSYHIRYIMLYGIIHDSVWYTI